MGLVRYVPTEDYNQGVSAYKIQAISDEQKMELQMFYEILVQSYIDEESDSD